jgi:hypothetical protein
VRDLKKRDKCNQVFRFDRENEVHPHGVVWKQNRVCNIQPENSTACAIHRAVKIEDHKRNARPDATYEIILEKFLASPHRLQRAAKKPGDEHVKKQMKKTAVEEHVRDELPKIELLENNAGRQSKRLIKVWVEHPLQQIDDDICDNDLVDNVAGDEVAPGRSSLEVGIVAHAVDFLLVVLRYTLSRDARNGFLRVIMTKHVENNRFASLVGCAIMVYHLPAAQRERRGTTGCGSFGWARFETIAAARP